MLSLRSWIFDRGFVASCGRSASGRTIRPRLQRIGPMQKTTTVVPEEQHFVLSNLPPSAAHKRLALAVALGAFVLFAVITLGPLQGLQLRRIDAFVPAYVTAMFVNDLITAFLLFAQFSIVRARSTLVVASGYLFTALILIPFVLVFPNVFAPGNL